MSKSACQFAARPIGTRWLLVLAAATSATCATWTAPAMGASATWNATGGGNWSTGSNWNPASAPGSTSGSGNTDVATFSSAITGNATINVDMGRIIGGVVFNNTTDSYTLGGAAINLANISGSRATVTVTGTHAIGDIIYRRENTSAYQFQVNSDSSLTISGNITRFNSNVGGGAVKVGAGTLTLMGTSEATGGFNLSGGTVLVGSGATLGSSGSSLNVVNDGTGPNTTTVTIRSTDSTDRTLDNALRLQKDGGTVIFGGAGSGNLSFTSTVTSRPLRNMTLQVDNSVTSIANSFVNDTGFTGAITKTGLGTLILSGNNTYTGATNVTAGTLRIDGSGSINSSAITINGGQLDYNSSTPLTSGLTFTNGTLGGTAWTGSSLNNLTIGANMTISPGNSPGTANTIDQTWANSGTYVWEINNATGTPGFDPGWDLLSGTGNLTITATSGTPFTIQVTSLDLLNVPGEATNFNEFSSFNWLIADFANEISTFSLSAFAVDTSNFQNAFSGNFSVARGDTVGGDNTQVFLTYVPVPEPATLALAACGGAIALAFVRRRRLHTRRS